jgi:hypothetical protein
MKPLSLVILLTVTLMESIPFPYKYYPAKTVDYAGTSIPTSRIFASL